MTASNKDIVEKVNAAFAENDIEGFLSYCADNVKWAMVGDRTVRGKDAIREWMASMDGEPPRFTVDAVIAEGDRVASHGDMTMTDQGGTDVSYSYCDVYRFQGGKIIELTAFVIESEAAHT